CGLLTSSEATDPLLSVTDSSSSHAVVRVTTPNGRTVVVKRPLGEAGKSGRSLSRELYVYRMTKWMPALAELLPRPLFIDERRHLLVLECEAQPPSAADSDGGDGGLTMPGVASQLGRKMAAWHRATTEVALWPSLAVGILTLPDALDIAVEGRT